jgi:hypothetical protein
MNKNELDKDQAALDGLYKKAIKKKPAAVRLKNHINYRDDYHRRTLSEAVAKINEVNHLPISERKENAAEFLRDLKHPPLIAERVNRLYTIMRINDRTGGRINMLSSPVTHHEAVTIKKKLMMEGPRRRKYKHLRDVLVPVTLVPIKS